MLETWNRQLQDLGLTPGEAQIYTALIRNGALGASAIASVTGIARSSVYPMLNSLVEKGLLETGASYGSRFVVVPPEQALPSLVAREREALRRQQQLAAETVEQRDRLARDLGDRLSSIAEPVETTPDELIQVIRSPRGVAERVERLQNEAKRSIEVFIKAPFFLPPGNPAEEKTLRRGLRVRAVYERAALDVADVKPYLESWIARGEEARVYEGELPHKLAIFDRHSVLVHLSMPGDQMRTLYIRHPELAMSLGAAFDSFWERANPIGVAGEKGTARTTQPPRKKKMQSHPARPSQVPSASRNGQVASKNNPAKVTSIS